MIKKIFIFIFFNLTFIYGSTWTQTTDSDFSTGEMTNIEVSGKGSDANLQLKTTSSSQFGCSLRVEGNSNFSLTSNLYKYSIRFTAQNTQTVSKIHLCLYRAGTSPTYRIGIQGNDINNNPDGSWLGSGNAYVDYAHSGVNEWKLLTLGASASLIKGNIYHIVIQYQSGTINGSNYMGVYGTYPQMILRSFDDSGDNYLTQLQSLDGTTWTDRNAQPMYILEGESSNEGSVYYTYNSGLSIYANRNFGEKIIITGQPKVVRRVSFRVRANGVSPPPNDHLYAVLYNVTDSIKVETVKLVDKNDITTAFEWYSADFSMPITLEVGKTYRLYLESPNSTSLKYYIPYRVEGYPQTGGYAIAENLTFDGINSVYTENTGSGWIENVNRYDILFRLFSATYETSGTFISSILDAGSSAFFNQISWLPVSQPVNTSIGIQLASSNNESGPWNFYGPDGTSNTYYTNASGETINSQHTGKRYLRYKVFLNSTDSAITPVLNSVSISYIARQMPGTELQTIVFPNPFSPYKNNMSINYILTKDSNVTIKIYTLLGDLVRTLNYNAGSEGGKGDSNGYNNKVEWDGKNGDSMIVGNGVYIMQIVAEPIDGSGKTTETKKIMVIK